MVTKLRKTKNGLYHIYHEGYRSETPMTYSLAHQHATRIKGGELFKPKNNQTEIDDIMTSINPIEPDNIDFNAVPQRRDWSPEPTTETDPGLIELLDTCMQIVERGYNDMKDWNDAQINGFCQNNTQEEIQYVENLFRAIEILQDSMDSDDRRVSRYGQYIGTLLFRRANHDFILNTFNTVCNSVIGKSLV